MSQFFFFFLQFSSVKALEFAGKKKKRNIFVCDHVCLWCLLIFGELQRMRDVSQEIKRVRAQMEENEELAILMRGLRGQNLKDTLFADNNIKLRLVEVCPY